MKWLMLGAFGISKWKRAPPGEGEAGVQAVKYADCQGDCGKWDGSRG